MHTTLSIAASRSGTGRDQSFSPSVLSFLSYFTGQKHRLYSILEPTREKTDKYFVQSDMTIFVTIPRLHRRHRIRRRHVAGTPASFAREEFITEEHEGPPFYIPPLFPRISCIARLFLLLNRQLELFYSI